jgi:hypothetical protein
LTRGIAKAILLLPPKPAQQFCRPMPNHRHQDSLHNNNVMNCRQWVSPPDSPARGSIAEFPGKIWIANSGRTQKMPAKKESKYFDIQRRASIYPYYEVVS